MTSDKMDLHYQQQLSALMDGDLSADEARFLLRRLQHDTELSGRWERWQLCGDVLRGQAQAPAPAGFADRIAASIAVQAPAQAGADAASTHSRNRLRRWGGGALAASVAMVALFMVRQQVPEETPTVASAPTSSPASGEPGASERAPAADTRTLAQAAATTAAGVAVASVPRRQESPVRRTGSATRTQQAASRNVASARATPRNVAAVASAAVPVVHAIAKAPMASTARDAFSNVQINPPAARPWPRAVLPQYPTGSSGAFNAGFSTDRASQTFYPFEPRATDVPPVRLPEPAQRE